MLTADCVAKSFGSLRVLTSASLRAVPGQFRVILGRNGAGKSTLLKVAVGWIAPDSGTVRVDDTVYTKASLPALAKRGVFYWPDEDVLSRAFTVRQQLTMLQQQFPGTVIEAAAEQARVTELLDERPDVLSGGERRRVGLAAVLVRRPRYLLAGAQHITWCTSGTTHELGTPRVAVQHHDFCREYLGPRYSAAIL